MTSAQEIVERWAERMVASHPEQASALRASKPDPFRNPLGYAIRKSLAELWEQLQHDMDPEAIDSALDAVVRIRAVQDMPPSEAVGFVDELRLILRQLHVTDLTVLEKRIDRLTLTACEKYAQCREQIAAARLHENERMTRMHRAGGKAGA